jgi:hypothetical protein
MEKALEIDLLAEGMALIEETLWKNVVGTGTSATAPEMAALRDADDDFDDGSCGPRNYDRSCSFCSAQQDWDYYCGG